MKTLRKSLGRTPSIILPVIIAGLLSMCLLLSEPSHAMTAQAVGGRQASKPRSNKTARRRRERRRNRKPPPPREKARITEPAQPPAQPEVSDTSTRPARVINSAAQAPAPQTVPAKTAQSNISTQPAATVTTANPPPVLSPSPEPSWLSTIEPNANLQSKDKVASETDWLGQSVANANLQPKNNVPSPELSWPGTIESNANLQPKNNLPRERDWEAIALLMRAAPHITVGAKGREFAEDLNGVKLEMVEIPAGVFYMGRSEGESPIPAIDNNVPRHKVTVQSFWMGKYEVTQAQWRAVMGTNPSHFPGDNLPVHDVSWDDAVEFCRKLSQMTGREYRLPSEAEWEYAARAGTTTPFAFGSHITSLQANFEDISLAGYTVGGRAWRQPAPVGSFPSNNFGLYDMHGNVWEWCQDWYHKNYKGAPNDASAWEIGGKQKERVLRGGGWNSHHIGLYSSYRAYSDPSKRDDDNGLRVVVVLNWLSR